MATDIGPIQLYVLSFEKPEFKGRIAEELEALRVSGVVRIVDSLAVVKDAQGDLMTARWSDLQETDGIPAGSVLGGLLGLELAAEGGPVDAGAIARAIADEAPDEAEQATLRAMFEDVPRGGAVLMLLIEHRWALPLAGAVRGRGRRALGAADGAAGDHGARSRRCWPEAANGADRLTAAAAGARTTRDRLAGPIYGSQARWESRASLTARNRGKEQLQMSDAIQSRSASSAPGANASSGADAAYDEDRGLGWIVFAGIMLSIVGILNIVYGIAAIDKSSFFTANAKYVITDLNTWGWVVLGRRRDPVPRRLRDLGRLGVGPLGRHHQRRLQRDPADVLHPGVPAAVRDAVRRRRPRDLRPGRLRRPPPRGRLTPPRPRPGAAGLDRRPRARSERLTPWTPRPPATSRTTATPASARRAACR